MREQVDRLTKLAGELLDLSRLDAGRLRVDREPVDLARVAELLAEEFAAARRAAATGSSPTSTAARTGLGDEQRVLQVGRALVENALRHTPAARRVRVRPSRDGERVALVVEDDGPGIGADARSRSSSASTAGTARRARRGAGSASRSRASWPRRCRAGSCSTSEPGRTVFTLSLPAASRRLLARAGLSCQTRQRSAEASMRRCLATVSGCEAGRRRRFVVLAAAVLGGAVSLLGAKARALADDNTSTVYVPAAARVPARATSAVSATARPLARQRLRAPLGSTRPARRASSPSSRSSTSGDRARCTGLGLRRLRERLHPDERARDHGRGRRRSKTTEATASSSGSRTATGSRRRSSAGTCTTMSALLRVDPGAHKLAPVPLGDSSRVQPATRSPRWAARSGTRTRSPSASSRPSALDRVADLDLPRRRRDPDDAPITHGNSGGPALRRPRPRDRHQRPDPQRQRHRRGSGLRDPDQRGAALDAPAGRDRPRRLRLPRRHDREPDADARAPLGLRDRSRRASSARSRDGSPPTRPGFAAGPSTRRSTASTIDAGGDVIVADRRQGRVESADDIVRARGREASRARSRPSRSSAADERRVVRVRLGSRPGRAAKPAGRAAGAWLGTRARGKRKRLRYVCTSVFPARP